MQVATSITQDTPDSVQLKETAPVRSVPFVAQPRKVAPTALRLGSGIDARSGKQGAGSPETITGAMYLAALGRTHARFQRWEEAATCYRKGIEALPEDSPARFDLLAGLAGCYVSVGDDESARSVQESLLAQPDVSPETVSSNVGFLGRIYARLGYDAEVVRFLELLAERFRDPRISVAIDRALLPGYRGLHLVEPYRAAVRRAWEQAGPDQDRRSLISAYLAFLGQEKALGKEQQRLEAESADPANAFSRAVLLDLKVAGAAGKPESLDLLEAALRRELSGSWSAWRDYLNAVQSSGSWSRGIGFLSGVLPTLEPEQADIARNLRRSLASWEAKAGSVKNAAVLYAGLLRGDSATMQAPRLREEFLAAVGNRGLLSEAERALKDISPTEESRSLLAGLYGPRWLSRPDRRIEILRELAKAPRNGDSYRLELGQALLEREPAAYDEAMEIARSLRRSAPRLEFEATRLELRVYRMSGKEASEAALLDACIRRWPEQWDMWLRRMVIAGDGADAKVLAGLTRSAVARFGKNSGFLIAAARDFAKSGQRAEAAKWYTRAIHGAASNPSFRLGVRQEYVRFLSDGGFKAEAVAVCDEALASGTPAERQWAKRARSMLTGGTSRAENTPGTDTVPAAGDSGSNKANPPKPGADGEGR